MIRLNAWQKVRLILLLSPQDEAAQIFTWSSKLQLLPSTLYNFVSNCVLILLQDKGNMVLFRRFQVKFMQNELTKVYWRKLAKLATFFSNGFVQVRLLKISCKACRHVDKTWLLLFKPTRF